MNLRIPNLFKSVREKLFKQKEAERSAIAKIKLQAGATKEKRITGGGNKGFIQKRKFAYKKIDKLRFGTFSPIKKFVVNEKSFTKQGLIDSLNIKNNFKKAA